MPLHHLLSSSLRRWTSLGRDGFGHGVCGFDWCYQSLGLSSFDTRFSIPLLSGLLLRLHLQDCNYPFILKLEDTKHPQFLSLIV
nr:hypothetical protein CFP56_64682 [Quercus suber]